MKAVNWFKNLNRESLYLLTLIFGLMLKFFALFFKDLNIDQLTFIGFVKDPYWASIFWDNYPPLAHITGKLINSISSNFLNSYRIFIFLISGLGFLILLRYFFEKFGFLVALLYAVFPVSIVDATTIRPLFLIEFFSILALVFYLRLSEGDFSRRNFAALFASLVFLLFTSYTTILLIIYLVLKFLTEGKDLKLRISFSRTRLLILLFLISSACAFAFLIRWNSLSWISSNGSFLESFKASFLWLRNLFGYSWFVFVCAVLLLIISQSKPALYLLIAIFLINPLLGTTAIEPRFIFCMTPILFYEFAKSISCLKSSFRQNFLTCALIFFAVWHSAWFLVNKRSDAESVIEWLRTQTIDFFVPGIGISRSAYYAINPNIPILSMDNATSSKCPLFAALIFRPKDKEIAFKSNLSLLKEKNFILKQEKQFNHTILENLHVYLFEKKCNG